MSVPPALRSGSTSTNTAEVNFLSFTPSGVGDFLAYLKIAGELAAMVVGDMRWTITWPGYRKGGELQAAKPWSGHGLRPVVHSLRTCDRISSLFNIICGSN